MLSVPVGQIALATLGACCRPTTRVSEAEVIASSIANSAALTSGAARKARPAVRAVRMSPRTRLVD